MPRLKKSIETDYVVEWEDWMNAPLGSSTIKTCTKCKEEKSLDEFAKDNRVPSGFGSWCRFCKNKDSRDFRKNNPEIASKQTFKHNIKSKYGLTVKQWQQIFELQQGYCIVCGKHQSELKKRLGVEHNHQTKKVRGLTCKTCNHLIDIYETKFYGLKDKIKDYLERNDG